MSAKTKPLFYALLLSIALHLAALGVPVVFLHILADRHDAAKAYTPLLQVSLVATSAQGRPSRMGTGERSLESYRRTTTLPKARLKPEPVVTAPPDEIPAADSADGSSNTPAQPLSTVVDLAVEPDAKAEPEPPPVAETPTEKPELMAHERSLPRRGELVYDLYWGEKRWRAGKATHRWSIDDQEHYTLSSESKTVGIFALLNPLTIRDESAGQITERGLVPSRFVTRFNAEAPAEVKIDWQQKQVVFANTFSNRTESIDGAVFDKLSFVYQLYLMQPKEKQLSVRITLGYRVELYLIETIGEEEIETGVGPLNTVHLSRVNAGAGDNHVDIWLAPTLDYLPVKMRLFNNRGQYYEQVISAICSDPG